MGEVHISGFFQVGTVFRDVAPERTWTNHSESWRKVPHTLGTHADNETLCKTEGHPVIGYYDSDVFCRKYGGHSIQVLPLRINMGLQCIGIIPDLPEATLLLDVGFYGCAVGTLVDPVAAAVKNLVERKQSTANGEINQLATLVRFRFPTGRTR